MPSLLFSGSSDRLNMSGTVSLDISKAYTVVWWWRPNIVTTGGSEQWYKSGANEIADDNGHCFWQIRVDASNYVGADKTGSGFSNVLYVGHVSGGTDRRQQVSAATLKAATSFTGWNMSAYRSQRTAAAYSGRLWQNGADIGTAYTTNHTPTALSGASATVGNFVTGTNSNCSAYITHFAVFDGYLSDQELADLYAGQHPNEITSRPIRLPMMDQVSINTDGSTYSCPDRVVSGVSWTVAGTATALTSPTVRDNWNDIAPIDAKGRSRFIDEIAAHTRRVASSHMWVLDQASGNVANIGTPASYGSVSGVTLASTGILPGDSRTCGSFDGSDDYVDIQNETNMDIERTSSYTMWAVIKIPATLGTGADYSILCKTAGSTTFAGHQFRVRKNAGGAALVHYIGSDFGTSAYIQQASADDSVPVDRTVFVAARVTGASTLPVANIELFIRGLKVSATTTGVSVTASVLNNNNMQIGRNNATAQYFNGQIAACGVIMEAVSYERLSAYGLMAENDVPNLYVKDAQGNIHRPGDDGYKPNLIIDTDADDDPGDAMALELAAGYSDAGLCSIKAFLVGQRNNHTEAAVVPAAVKKIRNLTARLATWKGTSIGTDNTSGTGTTGIATAIIADSTLSGGVATNVDDYGDTLTAFKSSVQNLPDKSVVYCMLGHGSVLADILNDSAARTLFESKVAWVYAMFGDFTPNSSAIGAAATGTLFHSDNFDTAGTDAEYNIAADPVQYDSLLSDLTATGIPLVVSGWNVGNRTGSSSAYAPAACRAMGLLTTSVGKTAIDVGSSATSGRVPWDQYCVYLPVHGPVRNTFGGFRWIGRGQIACNTAEDTPYAPASGHWAAGYTRLLRTPGTGSHWVLGWDDGANTINTSKHVVAHMDRYIASVESGGAIGDRVSRPKPIYILD